MLLEARTIEELCMRLLFLDQVQYLYRRTNGEPLTQIKDTTKGAKRYNEQNAWVDDPAHRPLNPIMKFARSLKPSISTNLPSTCFFGA